jgi:predicted metalloprotease with PDZ domain
VMWSSPPSVALLVGQDTTAHALADDWVALHEMLHLTHPTIIPRTPWISEGLATYLTEVARARSGTHTAERSWQELLRGFERGKEQADGRTMQEMIDESEPPGIYWVGAFIALRLDVELRRVTHNQRGLEDVLELLATKGSTSTVAGYGAAVDAVAGRPLFDALLAEDLRQPAFAGLEGLLEDLGVTPTPSGVKLQLARDSLLREALDGQSASSAQ